MKEIISQLSFVPALALIPLFFFLVFLINWKIERRRIMNGLLFNLFLLSFFSVIFIAVATAGFGASNTFFMLLSLVIVIGIVLVLMFGVYGVIIFLLWNTRQVLKKESRSLANMLGFYLALFLIALLIFQALPFDYPFFIQSIFAWANLCGVYFLCVFINYLTVNILYQFNRPKLNQDYVIVLGAGLINGRKVSKLLGNRIDRAIRFYEKQAEKTGTPPKIIMSGGKGRDEEVSEAFAMKEYALEKGIPDKDILLEDQSLNTVQNLANSKQIILEKGQDYKSIFVSSNYHIFRAALDALELNFPANGLGAKTAFYFLPNAFLREFAAILVKNKKRHLLVIIILFILIFSMFILNQFFT